MKRVGVVFILILAFFGLADAIYLTQRELSGAPLLCDIQNLSGCNIVAASQYSQVFGIPLAAFGTLFYGIIFVLAALEIVIFDRILRRLLQVSAFIGVLSSIYFTGLQMFVIGAFCIYCLASALITLLIFIFATLIEPLKKRPDHTPPVPHLPMPPGA